MPLPRFHRLEPEKQQAILDAAAAEFAAHGFHQASLNRIQAALGLSKGAFYYWFDDKEDLFLAALQDRLGTLREAVGGLAAGEIRSGSLWPQVRETLGALLVQAGADPQGVQLLKVAVGLGPDSSPGLHALWHAGDNLIARILQAGQHQGEVRRDLPLPLLVQVVLGVLEALDRYLLQSDSPPSTLNIPLTVEVYVDFLRRVVGP